MNSKRRSRRNVMCVRRRRHHKKLSHTKKSCKLSWTTFGSAFFQHLTNWDTYPLRSYFVRIKLLQSIRMFRCLVELSFATTIANTFVQRSANFFSFTFWLFFPFEFRFDLFILQLWATNRFVHMHFANEYLKDYRINFHNFLSVDHLGMVVCDRFRNRRRLIIT